MAVAAELNQNNLQEQLDHYNRVRNDTETWAAEALNGSMRTTFEYDFNGHELYAEDGGELGVIFDDAIESAVAIAQDCPTLLFELRRRLIERGELNDMVKMAQGELPNTMIVVSDYPPELMEVGDDVGGYNGSRKQTMLRVITFQNGKIRTITQSLEGSNRQALEAIYGSLDEVPEEGELLGQRIHKHMSAAEQDQLVGIVTNTYDESMAEQFGGEWHAGFLQPDTRSMADTYAFASAQKDLIEWFVRAKLTDSAEAEKLRFKLAATMHSRYENYLKGAQADVSLGSLAVAGMYNLQANVPLHHEVEQATALAVALGMGFNGCGETVTAESLAEAQLKEAGYGNKFDDGECVFTSKKCPDCKTPNVLTTVTKTHISGSCGCSKKRTAVSKSN